MPIPNDKGCFQVCRKSGKIVGLNPSYGRLKWLLPVAGCVALAWYLVRVIPKPSRAAYPCQQVAGPVGIGFLAYLAGALGLAVAWRKARAYHRQQRLLLMIASAIAAISFGLLIVNQEPGTAMAEAVNEPPNQPIGTARGIVPGRVAWVWDPGACHWAETNGAWWDDASTGQAEVDRMISRAVQCITRTADDQAAWAALFKNFNRELGKGPVGYQPGERIAIKINLNNDRTSYDDTPWINTSPQAINAVLRQLVQSAGVPEANITVYDATRYITPHLYRHVHDAFPEVKLVDAHGGLPGRIKTTWTTNRIRYAVKTSMGTSIASCAVEASYLINLYVAKGHPSAGVTLSGKNHYGSVDGREHTYINVKKTGYDQYNPLVELMGHKDLGGKTILNVCDMLYGCYHSDALPIKWRMPPFNGRWPASLLVSQDAIANDSVATDFLVSEFSPRADIPVGVNVKGRKVDMANCDAVLHEAAQAGHPPSGVVYAPNGDGARLKSLGVHEHWNNPIERKYSRNLGTGNGIELIPIFLDQAQTAR
jgi:Domain of unknown function (DUF362)